MSILAIDKSKKVTYQPFLAISIESDPAAGAFICAYLYGYYKDHHNKKHLIDLYFDDLKELEDYLMSFSTGKNIPFWLIGFNWGYDHVFLDNIIDDKTLSYSGFFITARLKNGIKLIDLCNYAFGKLEDWVAFLDIVTKYSVKKKDPANLREWIVNDAMVIYHLARFIEDLYVKELGIRMGSAMGSLPSLRLKCSNEVLVKLIDYRKKRELNEILWKLVKNRKITNDKVLKLLDVYSRESLLLEDDVQHLYNGLTRDRRAYRTYQNVLKAMWVRYYGRQRSRSDYGGWRREITSKHIDIDKKRCELCGRRRKLVRHHIHPIGKGGAHVPENMMALCRNCHRLVHTEKGYRKAVKASGLFKEAMKKLYKLRQCAKAEGVRAGKRALKELAKIRP